MNRPNYPTIEQYSDRLGQFGLPPLLAKKGQLSKLLEANCRTWGDVPYSLCANRYSIDKTVVCDGIGGVIYFYYKGKPIHPTWVGVYVNSRVINIINSETIKLFPLGEVYCGVPVLPSGLEIIADFRLPCISSNSTPQPSCYMNIITTPTCNLKYNLKETGLPILQFTTNIIKGNTSDSDSDFKLELPLNHPTNMINIVAINESAKNIINNFSTVKLCLDAFTLIEAPKLLLQQHANKILNIETQARDNIIIPLVSENAWHPINQESINLSRVESINLTFNGVEAIEGEPSFAIINTHSNSYKQY